MPCSAELIVTPCSMEGMLCYLRSSELHPEKIEFRENSSSDSKLVKEIESGAPIRVRLLERKIYPLDLSINRFKDENWGRVEYEIMNAEGTTEKIIGWIFLDDAYRLQEKDSRVENYFECLSAIEKKVCIDLFLNRPALYGFLRIEILGTGRSKLFYFNFYNSEKKLIEIYRQFPEFNRPLAELGDYFFNRKEMFSTPYF